MGFSAYWQAIVPPAGEKIMKLRCRVIVSCALGLCLAGLPGCDAANETTVLDAPVKETPDPARAEASIKEAQAARISALNRRDVDGAVSVYAPNATLVVPNATPLTDPASIRANYASLLGDDGMVMTVTPTRTWVSAGADFAVTTARITVHRKSNGDRPGIDTGIDSASQSVWQRQADGTWKIVSEYNVALPARDTDADQANTGTSGETGDEVAIGVPSD